MSIRGEITSLSHLAILMNIREDDVTRICAELGIERDEDGNYTIPNRAMLTRMFALANERRAKPLDLRGLRLTTPPRSIYK